MNPNEKEIMRLGRELLDEASNILMANLPEMRRIASEAIEVVFMPKAIAKQVALAIILETGAVTINQVMNIIKRIYCNFSSRSRLIRQLEDRQKTADTQDEWMNLAEQIDNIQGNDVWRSEQSCALYESDRISSRVDELVHLMRRRDVFDLMFTLRGGIARNKFGLLHEGLFSKALAGSKVLVETYHNVVCKALEFVCEAPTLPGEDPIPTEARLAFFNETRHSYGRSALMLSGGAALGFYHVGVVKALMENGLLPRVISGASAGSIVCAMAGTRTDEECKRDLFMAKGTVAPGHSGAIMTDFFRPIQSRREVESSKKKPHESDLKEVLHNTAGAFSDAKKTFQLFVPIGVRNVTSSLFDVFTGHKRAKDVLKSDLDHFRLCCQTNIGNFTFQEAFDRTGRILNIIVSPQNRSDPPRLLNYLTAPHVLVWSAAVASSSLPGVFEANRLLVKDADGTERYESANVASFIDGSMEQDLPMQQLAEIFNINHFIISQANPHAVMLASFNVNKSVWSNRFIGIMHGVLLFLKRQVKEWIGSTIELIGGQRVAPIWDTRRGFGSQFFTQEYEGRDIDISLIPWASHRSLFSAGLHCLYNPSLDDFFEWGYAAERETWRYIPKIKSHVAEEMTLDRCVQRLRKQLLTECQEKEAMGQACALRETTERMSERVPSFYTSRSLVNLGGLGITDRYLADDDSKVEDKLQVYSQGIDVSEVPPGWNGMGLKGNFSSGSLNRSTSGGSGLFLIDGESDDESTGMNYATSKSTEQGAGEPPSTSQTKANSSGNLGSYLKTTNMAEFYYRKTKSHGSLAGITENE